MRNLWILFKTNIVNTFSLNLLKKKFSRKSAFLRIWIPIITAILGLAIFAFIFFYLYSIAQLFVAVGKFEGIIYFGVSFGALFSLISTISKANSYLFQSKDYDLLMSLPINSKTVITSKLLSLLFLNYISFGFVYIPTLFWHAYFTMPSILFYVFAIIFFILGPLVIVVICSGVSYLFGLILSKLKHRNFIQTIGMLIFFLAVMYFSFSFNNINSAIDENDPNIIINMVDNIIGFCRTLFYPSKFVVEALVDYNIISFVIYAAISIVPFILFIYIVGHNFVKANARARVSYTDKNFRLKEQKYNGQFKALFGKELRTYFSNSAVVLNTIVGPIMGTIMLVMFILSPQLTGLGEIVSSDTIVALVIGLITIMNSIMTTTSSSVSLEGKQFWILKSLPIKEEKIFLSKIFLNIIIAVPFSIINTVIVTFVLEPTIIDLLLILILPLLVSTLMGVLGLYINIVFPKLNWTTAVRVVKQSLSSGLTMLIGFLLMIGLAFLFFQFDKLQLDIYISYLLIALIMILLIVIFTIILITDGKKRFRKLNN